MLTIVVALALASSPSPDERMATWMQCLANAAERFAVTKEPTDIAADAAMGACAAEEGALEAAERKSVWGDDARRRMDEIHRDGRLAIRQRVIARIVELRNK
jgi:hypothetical protein